MIITLIIILTVVVGITASAAVINKDSLNRLLLVIASVVLAVLLGAMIACYTLTPV